LAPSTKKEDEKIKSSLGFFFDLIDIIVFISISVAVPRPWGFHNWRRKRWVDDWLRGLKTHRSVHLWLIC
jgi:hypothetical protein